MASKTDHDGEPFEATFDPAQARCVRVYALKPDGPQQRGVQMSVAEPEQLKARQPLQ